MAASRTQIGSLNRRLTLRKETNDTQKQIDMVTHFYTGTVELVLKDHPI